MKIALTFDDGPDNSNTEEILDVLREFSLKATFFVIGERLSSRRLILQKIVADKHEIGNHTWSHPRFSCCNPSKIHQELNDTNLAISEYCGLTSMIFRPPFGETSLLARTIGAELGLSQVLWNVDSLDWKHRDPIAIGNRIMTHVYQNSVILMHDIFPTTARAMRQIAPRLVQLETSSLTISALRSEISESHSKRAG